MHRGTFQLRSRDALSWQGMQFQLTQTAAYNSGTTSNTAVFSPNKMDVWMHMGLDNMILCII